MRPEDTPFNLRELAAQAGVTPRTIHFYIQQGLLPPAGSLGPQARYGAGHLARIRLIKRLQKQHLPLAEISGRIRSLSDGQVERLLLESEPDASPARSGSALDYVRTLLSRAPAMQDDARAVASMLSGAPASPPPPVAEERSQWERIALVPEIELHVRRPLSRARNRQLDRLLESARQILQKED